MDLSVKSSIAVLMNIGMRKRTYILMLSLMSFMMAFSQKDTRVGYRDMFREFNTLQGGMTRYDGWNFTVEIFMTFHTGIQPETANTEPGFPKMCSA